jgi:hypothetical protein
MYFSDLHQVWRLCRSDWKLASGGSDYYKFQQILHVFLYGFSLSFWNPELFQVDWILFLELNVMSCVQDSTCFEEAVADGFMMLE